MISDLFMAPRERPRSTYLALLDSGRGSELQRRHGLLFAKHLDLLVLRRLAKALGSWDSVRAPDLEDEGDELYVCEIEPGFSKKLAEGAADPARLRHAAQAWITAWSADLATIPAFGGVVPPGMLPTLDDWWPTILAFANLAARAKGNDWSVYVALAP